MSDGLVVSFENLPALTAALSSLSSKIQSGGKVALYQEAERMMTISKQHVPVDKGNLRSTGHVEPPYATPEGVEVELGYGGPAAGGLDVGYALVVHEDLDLSHKTGQAKFLESPMREEIASGRSGEFVGKILDEFLQS